jgi:PhnB protein
MASRLNPYIGFDGNARQAMEFYRDVFGGTLAVSTFGEFGMQDSPHAEKVMHSLLETPAGYTIMGSDTPPEMEYRSVCGISVSISGDDAEELRGYWDKLCAKGTVTMPLAKQAWGDDFGMCLDEFGVTWMFNISAPQA